MSSSSDVDGAVRDALDVSKHPVKAEQVFYLLKALQTGSGKGSEDVLNPIAKLQKYFSLSVIYSSLKKLEELELIKKSYGVGAGGLRESKRLHSIILLKEDAVVPMGKRGPKPGKKKDEAVKSDVLPRVKDTLVFLDENEFIRAKINGIKFNLGEILSRVSQKIGGKLLRVFVYVSEKTEIRHFREIRSLYASGHSEVRYIKTESLPGEVDRKMRDDIVLWSQTSIADRIVVGTADGGPEFQSAIQLAKENGKEVVLLEAAGVFNQSLAQNVHGRINVTAANPRKEEFQGLVTEIRLNLRADRRNQGVKFLSSVAIEIHSFFQQESEARFMKMVNYVWDRLQPEWFLKGYSSDDVRVAIDALAHQGYAFWWDNRQDFGSDKPVKVYRYRDDSEVMRILTQR